MSIALARMVWGGALVVATAAGCGAAPRAGEGAAQAALPADPTHFSADRFHANLRELVALGPRPAGSEAVAAALAWVRANAAEPLLPRAIVLAAPLSTREAGAAALEADSSGLALVVEAARALAVGGPPAHVSAIDGETAADPQLRGAPLVVFVRRACGLPQRRDLLSHRVLRERFFAIAGVETVAFDQSDAPHAALLAAGARRVVALDAPPADGGACDPGPFGDALVRFVRDASSLLARGRVNSTPAVASHASP